MCLKLEDRHYCLSYLSLLGILQSVVAIPVVVLSSLLLVWTTLGPALSPIWAGLVLLAAGTVAILIRPTRLACVVFFHVLFNAFALCGCLLAAMLTGLYGTAVQLPDFNAFTEFQEMRADNTTCIFADGSPLYTAQLSEALRPIDSLVTSCVDLADYWTYLIGLMSLCFVGFILSGVAIISNCIVPCVEGEYDKDPAV